MCTCASVDVTIVGAEAVSALCRLPISSALRTPWGQQTDSPAAGLADHGFIEVFVFLSVLILKKLLEKAKVRITNAAKEENVGKQLRPPTSLNKAEKGKQDHKNTIFDMYHMCDMYHTLTLCGTSLNVFALLSLCVSLKPRRTLEGDLRGQNGCSAFIKVKER